MEAKPRTARSRLDLRAGRSISWGVASGGRGPSPQGPSERLAPASFTVPRRAQPPGRTSGSDPHLSILGGHGSSRLLCVLVRSPVRNMLDTAVRRAYRHGRRPAQKPGMQYPARDRSPPSRSFPTRAPAASAASSAGAGSVSGPRRSRTLTTRIALPIARFPRATARPQPQMASRPDDRSNGERTCSVPNDRTPALASGGGPLGRSTQAIHHPFAPELRSDHPPSIERRDARKGVHLPLPAHRTGADRSM